MKKKYLFLLPAIAISAIGVSGCSVKLKARITYGTYIDQAATKIKYVDLVDKIADKENLLISVYQDSMPCGCWDTFHSVLDAYVRTYHTKVYYIARSQFVEDEDHFGLTILNEGTKPTFAFIKDGKRANEFIYDNDNRKMFEELDGLRSTVTHIARDPLFMMVDQDYLDNALFISKKDKVLIQYIWNFCPDCLDCFPNVMQPYAQKSKSKEEIWLIDLAIPGLLFDDQGKINKSNDNYVQFLEDHHLSEVGDETFGYGRGFVPSIQIWEKGVLKDMSVYFNDTVDYVDDKYKVTVSYYSSSRIANLKYTNTVIEGLVIPEEEVEIQLDEGGLTYSWKKDFAREYHKPILEDFLDMYLS